VGLVKPPIRARAETALNVALQRVGLERIERRPADMEAEFLDLYQRCERHTMTSVERMYAVWQSVRYILARGVPGDFVECGVWQGGSSMLAALTCERAGDRERVLHLYDTFEGMPEPTAEDGPTARHQWARHEQEDHNAWCYSSLDEVRENMLSTGLARDRLKLIKGKVEETIPGEMPAEIALLRLDTDWYTSTKHELVHLYPVLSRGGVVIIDDYGFWRGARSAVDEYLGEQGLPLLLTRVDPTGRVAVKP
jgi:O-methyltransferase